MVDPELCIALIFPITALVNPVSTVPYPRDPNFIDRKDIFSQIAEQLQNHHRVSLCGLGGVGKSQIAIEYAHRFRQSHPQSHVFWVYAASYATFMQACHNIARSLKLPCDDPRTNPCELVAKWLDEDHSWLMILDNADNAKLFFPSSGSESPTATFSQAQRPLSVYLPNILNPQKSVLVTTRSRHVGQDLAHRESCVEVPPLSSQEAMELLQLKVKEAIDPFDKHSAERLLDILGCSPLAITQAAAFIVRNRMTIQYYLADLERDKQNLADYLSEELQDPRRPLGPPNSVFRTWKLSFDQIEAHEPQTAKLLSLISMLDPQRVPEKLLRRLVKREVDFRMAIGTLDGFALIRQQIRGRTYSIHPLVQASMHYWLEQRSQKADSAGQALQLLAEEFPFGHKYEHKETCESMLAHAQAVLCHRCISKIDMENRALLLYKVACFHRLQGRYVSAYQAILESYDICQEQKGDIAIDTLNSLDVLAGCLLDQGKYDAAEKMQRRALEGREKMLGFEDPGTLISVNNLALVLGQQGKYKEAEEMHARALEGKKKVLGVDDPETLASVHNLASVLESQGKYKEAEEMYRRALDGKEKVLGVDHPQTLNTVGRLALMLKGQERYKEAEKMYRRALDGKEKVLGVDHPKTLNTVGNLAVLLDSQSRYHEASILYERASAGFLKALGPDHPNTRNCSNDYSAMKREMQDQGMDIDTLGQGEQADRPGKFFYPSLVKELSS
ncbi:P-loop containing nucleoside triphosphate hydrolase protein [Usnea florida]